MLLATRFVRNIGQGALAVDVALHLRAFDWLAVAISAVLSAALITGGVLILPPTVSRVTFGMPGRTRGETGRWKALGPIASSEVHP